MGRQLLLVAADNHRLAAKQRRQRAFQGHLGGFGRVAAELGDEACIANRVRRAVHGECRIRVIPARRRAPLFVRRFSTSSADRHPQSRDPDTCPLTPRFSFYDTADPGALADVSFIVRHRLPRSTCLSWGPERNRQQTSCSGPGAIKPALWVRCRRPDVPTSVAAKMKAKLPRPCT